jgi:hypothetical protein
MGNLVSATMESHDASIGDNRFPELLMATA